MTGNAEFRFLGATQIRAGNAELKVPGGLTLIVLIVLLLNAGRSVSAGRIIELRWGENPPGKPEGQIENSVSKLNDLFRRAGLGALITRTACGYTIDADSSLVDVTRFQELVTGARQSASRAEWKPAANLMDDALSLWRGDTPLGGLTYPNFVHAEVTPLLELHLAAREERCGIGLQLDQSSEILPELRRLTADNPLSEPVREKYIYALSKGPGTAAALNAYNSYRDQLAREMGTDPGARLQELHAVILHGDRLPLPSWKS